MQSLNKYLISGLIAGAMSVSAYAAERDVYDSDHDGLIEIEDLQDLNEIRNNPVINADGSKGREIFGHTLYQSKAGCPDTGCTGYELVADLNFDSNNNGNFDEGDQYWNAGKGWEPIGGFNLKFAAEFHGNGYALHNLVVKRPGEYFVGLFGYNEQAYFHDFKFSADVITGRESGALLAYSWKTRLENIQAEVTVKAVMPGADCEVRCDAHSVGGLTGPADELMAKNVTLISQVSGVNRVGGFSSEATSSDFSEVAVKTVVQGKLKLGGVVGVSTGNSYSRVFVNGQISGDNTLGVLTASADDDTLKNILLTGSIAQPSVNRGISLGSLAGWVNQINMNQILSLVGLPDKGDNAQYFGALYGQSSSIGETKAVYWAADLAHTNQSNGRNTNSGRFYSYADLTDLQCATAAADACNNVQLLEFNQQKNSQDQLLWEFGTNTEAPAMKINNFSFSDMAGDGNVDNWPELTRPIVTPDEPDTPDEPGKPTSPGNGNSSGSSSSGGALLNWLLFSLTMLVVFTRRRIS